MSDSEPLWTQNKKQAQNATLMEQMANKELSQVQKFKKKSAALVRQGQGMPAESFTDCKSQIKTV